MNTPTSFNTFLKHLSRKLGSYLNEDITAVYTTHEEEGIELYTLSSDNGIFGHVTHDIKKTIVFLSEQYLLDKKMHRWALSATIKGRIISIDISSKQRFDEFLDSEGIEHSAALSIVENYAKYCPSQADLTKNCQKITG